MKKGFSIIKYQWKNKRGKLLFPLFVYGLFGMFVEVVATALSGNIAGFYIFHKWSMVGYVSIYMLPCHIIGALGINILNDIQNCYEKPMWVQTIYGGLYIAFVEFWYGILVNKILMLNCWDYSISHKYHLYGQICLQNFILFTLAVPLFIWVIDWIDYNVYENQNGCNYGIFYNYIKLITGK